MKASLPAPLGNLRKQARSWARPVASTLHKLLTYSRHLPEPLRNGLDQCGALAPLPNLVVESTTEDLLETMKDARVDRALVIAHPPWISNDFVQDLCVSESSFYAAVNIPKGTPKPGAALRTYVKQGAKALKIHPAFDGEGVDSPRYRGLLRTASDLGLPVIIHTGCIHSRLLYKNPTVGGAEQFTKWYETYSKTNFVLSHMNFHDPQTALDLCEQFPNLWVDTSWQPAETIAEAVRRIGAERVLFGSDWPLLGNNIRVGRERIQDCIDTGLLNPEQAELILGVNATKLLGIAPI